MLLRLTAHRPRTRNRTRCIHQISYSFEIVSARLVRPPLRPPDQESCRKQCPRGKPCRCRDGGDKRSSGNPGRGRGLSENGGSPPVVEVVAAEGEGDEGEGKRGGAGGGEGGGAQHPHHSLHMGVNDVATLVLEDNQGNTYDFYTFQVCVECQRTSSFVAD